MQKKEVRHMIYTVTFNPCLDYIVGVEDFQLGMTNRTCSEQMFAGGKGINVSIVLKNLGIESTALGFIAGFTGEEIRRKVEKMGITSEFIQLENGFSRINIKLKSIDGTEINGTGPSIGSEELERLLKKLDTLKKGDVLILAGSIPASLPDSIYSDIMERLEEKEVMIVVDATKDLLVNVLKYHPFLIKPNNHELGDIFGVEIRERDQVAPYAKKLQEMGARNVLVSMAGKGAVLLAEDGSVYESPAPKGKLINAVGAGDSMVAGFIYGYLNGGSYADAFRYGVCTGSASAFSEELATKKEVLALMDANKKLF